MRKSPSASLSNFERTLLAVSGSPWDSIYRIAVGYLFLPLFRNLSGAKDSGWKLVPLFLAVLLALRLLVAFIRRSAPVSDDVKAVSLKRRILGKRFDSYQWQKLLWFGVGMAFYVVWSRQLDMPSAGLTLLCLIGGAFGTIIWRHRVTT